MKWCKKIVSLLLVCSLILPSMTVNAASKLKYEEEADNLYELGLFDGYSTTHKELGLDDPLTREQAMKIIVEMLGWEVDLWDASDFEDVSSWAQPYVAKAVKKGITNGMGSIFGGKEQATMQQLTTWYLRALGYDQKDSWENAAVYAMQLGMVTPFELVAFDKPVKRDELAGVAYKTLTQTPKGKAVTLIQQLVLDGVVNRNDAIALGLDKQPEPEKLEISYIEPLNLVQFKVQFSTQVDEETALDEKNYDISKGSIEDVTLSEDHTAAIVTHTKINNQEDIEIEVDDIKDFDKLNTIDDYEEEVTYMDFDVPEIESIEIIGEHILELRMSEPIESADESAIKIRDLDKKSNILVHKITSADSTTDLSDYAQVLHVYVYKTLHEGDYEVKINTGIKDYASYSTYPTTEVVYAAEDESGPKFVDYVDVTSTEVTLLFDETLKVETIDKDDIYHTNARNKAKVDVKPNGNKLTITFPDNKPLGQGVSYVTIASDKLMDNWGNLAGTIIAPIEREIDDEGPVIDKIEVVAADKLKITFDEVVEDDSAEKVSNYTVEDSNGKDVDIKYIYHDGKTVTLTFDDDLDGGYTITVEDVEDLYENKADSSEYVDIEDIMPPKLLDAKLYDISSKVWTIIVKFNEPMIDEGQYSVLDLDKYQLNGKQLSLDSDVDIDLTDGGKTVEINIPRGSKHLNVHSGSNYLEIAKVADELGNTSTGLLVSKGSTTSHQIGGGSIGDVTYVAKAITDKKIVLTFSAELEIFNADDFLVYIAETASPGNRKMLGASGFDTDFDDDGNWTFTIDLIDQLPSTKVENFQYNIVGDSALESCSLYIDVPSSRTSKSGYGELVEHGMEVVLDSAPPKVVLDSDDEPDVVVTKDVIQDGTNPRSIKLRIPFTEELSVTNPALVSSDIQVLLDNSEIVYLNEYRLDINQVSTGDLLITIPYDSTDEVIKEFFNNPNKIRVKLDDSVSYLVDGKGNKVDDLNVVVDLDDYPEVVSSISVVNYAETSTSSTFTFSDNVTLTNDFVTMTYYDKDGNTKDSTGITLTYSPVIGTSNNVHQITHDATLLEDEELVLEYNFDKVKNSNEVAVGDTNPTTMAYQETRWQKSISPTVINTTTPILTPGDGSIKFDVVFNKKPYVKTVNPTLTYNDFIESVKYGDGTDIPLTVKIAALKTTTDTDDTLQITITPTNSVDTQGNKDVVIKLDYNNLADKFNTPMNNDVIAEAHKLITIEETKKPTQDIAHVVTLNQTSDKVFTTSIKFDETVSSSDQIVKSLEKNGAINLLDVSAGTTINVVQNAGDDSILDITITLSEANKLTVGTDTLDLTLDLTKVQDGNANPSTGEVIVPQLIYTP